MNDFFFDDLKCNPFFLTQSQIHKVKKSIDDLPLRDKVSQLFTLLLLGERQQDIDLIRRIKPGGVTRFFSQDLDFERTIIQSFFDEFPVPPLISADLEGSRQSFSFGTELPNQMALAATNSPKLTYDCAEIMAREGKQLGLTWSFTPVVDINSAFRSSIVGTRSYGSDLDKIKEHALAHITGLQKNGVAATIKHWPGEGYDDRDQHLVTTMNPLSYEEWLTTYGEIYSSLIKSGVISVMSAHISFPAYMREIYPDGGEKIFKPASINYDITTGLLRDKFGFNGIIVSDATEMAGLGSWITRESAPVEIINAGCDVILFSLDPERDIESVITAVTEGRLSEDRINQSVARVLALKHKSGLFEKKVVSNNISMKLSDDINSALGAFSKAPTLVKNLKGDIPISVDRNKRVLCITNGINHPIYPEGLNFELPDMLRNEGFDVTIYQAGMDFSWKDYDLALYLLGDEDLLTRSHIFIDWSKIMGGIGRAFERPWNYIPSVMISFGHPYYLYDAPRIPAYINAYSTTVSMQKAVVECLLGRQDFTGVSPVDAYCGLEDAYY